MTRRGAAYIARLDQLAERVASADVSVAQATRDLGWSEKTGRRMWADIRAGLGEQAK